MSTTVPDKFTAEAQTQQVLILTPSPGPGTLKPPLPTIVPQATVFQPDPLATPLGAGALFIGSGPFSSQGYYLESQWYQDVDAGNRRIFVGVGSIGVPGASKPTDQGVVIAVEAKWINGDVIFLEGAKGEYRTAQAAGSLHITDAQGARLVLESSNGATYYFDVPSRQFVDSLNAPPPPTVTRPPDPTIIPTYAPPTQGPLPTAYLNPPTPTSLAGSIEPCHATDLHADAAVQAGAGSIFFSVLITNTGQKVCYVQGPPDIKLLDQAGQPLDITYRLFCEECGPAPYQTPMPAATQTAVAHDRLYARFAIAPGEKLGILLLSPGFCKTFPPTGLTLRLMLPDNLGFVEIPANALGGARCYVPTAEWSIAITEYSRIP